MYIQTSLYCFAVIRKTHLRRLRGMQQYWQTTYTLYNLSCSVDDISWSSDLKSITIKPFTGQCGPNVPLPSSPAGLFQLFFTTALLDYIVQQTNQYALECMGGEKFAKWNQVTVEELEAYMGFMILMGIVRLPSVYDYWQKEDISLLTNSFQNITRSIFWASPLSPLCGQQLSKSTR